MTNAVAVSSLCAALLRVFPPNTPFSSKNGSACANSDAVFTIFLLRSFAPKTLCSERAATCLPPERFFIAFSENIFERPNYDKNDANLGAAPFPNGGRNAVLFCAVPPVFFDPKRVEKCGSMTEPQGRNRPKWGTHDGVQGKSLPLHVLSFSSSSRFFARATHNFSLFVINYHRAK